MTQALIVGYGSIGQRHARVLQSLGAQVSLVTRQDPGSLRRFETAEEALTADAFDYVVVANPTGQHAETIAALEQAGYRGRLLVEKPLAAKAFKTPRTFSRLAVAYNLRFHPIIAELRRRLQDETLLTLDLRVGQHLSEWRPGRDLRSTYSASAAQGGGALRDLSHELDYLLWIAGGWRRVAAVGGNLGVHGIDADEGWSIVAEMERCPVSSVQLNYLDQPARRRIVANTRGGTIEADLIAGTLAQNGREERFSIERDETYRAMHAAMLEDASGVLCSADEGEAVLALIEAVEQAGRTGQWVSA